MSFTGGNLLKIRIETYLTAIRRYKMALGRMHWVGFGEIEVEFKEAIRVWGFVRSRDEGLQKLKVKKAKFGQKCVFSKCAILSPARTHYSILCNSDSGNNWAENNVRAWKDRKNKFPSFSTLSTSHLDSSRHKKIPPVELNGSEWWSAEISLAIRFERWVAAGEFVSPGRSSSEKR